MGVTDYLLCGDLAHTHTHIHTLNKKVLPVISSQEAAELGAGPCAVEANLQFRSSPLL